MKKRLHLSVGFALVAAVLLTSPATLAYDANPESSPPALAAIASPAVDAVGLVTSPALAVNTLSGNRTSALWRGLPAPAASSTKLPRATAQAPQRTERSRLEPLALLALGVALIWVSTHARRRFSQFTGNTDHETELSTQLWRKTLQH